MTVRALPVATALLLSLSFFGCKSSNPQSSAAAHAGAEEAGCGDPNHDCSGHEEEPAAEETVTTAFDAAPEPGTKARCPVAKKVFTVTAETVTSEHNGKHYAFCCPGCKTKFDEAPDAHAAQ